MLVLLADGTLVSIGSPHTGDAQEVWTTVPLPGNHRALCISAGLDFFFAVSQKQSTKYIYQRINIPLGRRTLLMHSHFMRMALDFCFRYFVWMGIGHSRPIGIG